MSREKRVLQNPFIFPSLTFQAARLEFPLRQVPSRNERRKMKKGLQVANPTPQRPASLKAIGLKMRQVRYVWDLLGILTAVGLCPPGTGAKVAGRQVVGQLGWRQHPGSPWLVHRMSGTGSSLCLRVIRNRGGERQLSGH